ncbi:S24 family peptidase [Sphingomonas sp. Y38-1Y]|uniref:S24 family peptidase n=1 Tax=Sphingomonas sp. Y38-1Y TaxID=3078265 RepID=UPI0028E2C8A3|nr:S24 family peptidase [Sphingomonas sp. Y38-1Y]
MLVEDPRAALARLAAERGVSLTRLSRLIGRNAAYVHQHVTRGSPRRLDEQDRETIAAFLGVDEALLGGRAAPAMAVARYDLSASAGPGTLAEIEAPRRAAMLPAEMLAGLGVRADDASMIRVAGESMVPTLWPGDDILVDAARTDVARSGGVYVLRLGDVLMVKRVAREAGGVRVTSDNPEAESPGLVAPADLSIIGRVVWVSRRL